MTSRLSRRGFLGSLAASALWPAAALSAPEAPPGSARYVVEILVFRQPGTPPPPQPVAALPTVTTLPGRVEPLPETAWQLASAGETLPRRGYPLLAHAAWLAIVPPNGRTTAKLEDVLPPGTGLAGDVAVQRSQYLFLGLDVDWTPTAGTTYGLRERRRIKFGEHHYFDHPAFGVVAQVVPARGEAAAD